MDELYPRMSWGMQCAALAKATKVLARSQIQRITVDPDDPKYTIQSVGISIDTLEVLCSAIDVTPSELLSPHFRHHKDVHDALADQSRGDRPDPRPLTPRHVGR